MMKSNNTIILIGGIHLNHKPTCGETMKNQLFLKRFNELFEKVIPIDTFEWQKHPFCLLRILFVLLFHPKAKVIISASGASRYLIHFLNYFPINKNCYFWVVGGDLPAVVRKGKYRVDALNKLVYIPVQGRSMVAELSDLGVYNSVFVPNSKPITYHPLLRPHRIGQPYRFVFLSRIHPDKGIREIAEATKRLDDEGFKGQYLVDFYGAKDDHFAEEFDQIIVQNDAFHYKGYLDLTSDKGYETLSSYDMMLFPTYWRGEGFPGVVLDASISGVPIIASNWNLNTEVVEDGKTGIIIPAKDSSALFDSMRKVITGQIEIDKLKYNCVINVQKYDFREVLSEELMQRLHLAD